MKKVIIILSSVIIIALMGYQLFLNKKQLDAKATPQKIIKDVSVEVFKVVNKDFKSELNLTGSFTPNKEVNVLSETNGKIIALNVKEGDVVSAGKVLAQVDKEIISAQLMTAEAQLEKLQKDLSRMENLMKSNATTDVQYQEVKLGVKSAESNVKILKKQLANTSILAPISGVISRKMIENGSVINPGAPTFVITDISKVKLNIMMPENSVVRVAEGKKVDVSIDAFNGEKTNGVISLIPVKANQSQLFPVEITVDNNKSKKIRAGMFGRVIISEDKDRSSLSIPRTALIGSLKDPKVFVVENNRAYLRSIKISESESDFLEVLSGLKENELVVTNGQINLTNNVKVTVVSRES